MIRYHPIAALLSSCIATATRWAALIVYRARRYETATPIDLAIASDPVELPVTLGSSAGEPARVIPFRVKRAVPSGTIGPCLSCRCDHVDVSLLTNFIRYCECPRCGSAWTEPARARSVDPDSPYYPSEPLKFVRDRN